MKRAFLLIVWCGMVKMLCAQDVDTRPTVRLETSAGVIRVVLFDETPLHRENFLRLTKSGFYDGTLFHRVIRDFMIQGGDPDSRGAAPGVSLGNGGPGYDLPAEICFPDLYHWRGVLAMAREGDEINPERRSSGSQFYIVWGKKTDEQTVRRICAARFNDTGVKTPRHVRESYERTAGCPHLDGAYTIFGEVIDGLNVVKKIQKMKTDSLDRPLHDVLLIRAVVEQ